MGTDPPVAGDERDLTPFSPEPGDSLLARFGAEALSPARLRRLAEAIAGAGCGFDEDLIVLYVSDELEGREDARFAGRVRRHLRACRRCRQAYELLLEALRDERLAPPPREPLEAPRLSFLRDSPPGLPWFARASSRLAGGAPGLTFVWSLAFLRGAFFRESLSPVPARSDPAAAAEAPPFLLLTETLDVGGERMEVEVTATRASRAPELADLHVALAGPDRPPNLRVRLSWGGEPRSAAIDEAGRAVVRGLPLDALRRDLESGSFAIAFEAVTA